MLKSGGSILDANPGSDLDAIQQLDFLQHNLQMKFLGISQSIRINEIGRHLF